MRPRIPLWLRVASPQPCLYLHELFSVLSSFESLGICLEAAAPRERTVFLRSDSPRDIPRPLWPKPNQKKPLVRKGTVLLRGPVKGREAERHFGKAGIVEILLYHSLRSTIS